MKSWRPKILLIDVYETMLDMSGVEKRINNLLNNRLAYTLWLETFMQYTFVDNSTLQFNDFNSIAAATLRMTSTVMGRHVEEGAIDEILLVMKHLPLKDGVQQGLSQLIDRQFRLAALTNCPEQMVQERMERTGLVSYFEKVLSAEHVQKYKPAKIVYDWAANSLKALPEEILLVSAHGWDIAGAENAGMQTAYIDQPGQVLYPLAPRPKFICKDLRDLARQLEAFE